MVEWDECENPPPEKEGSEETMYDEITTAPIPFPPAWEQEE